MSGPLPGLPVGLAGGAVPRGGGPLGVGNKCGTRPESLARFGLERGDPELKRPVLTSSSERPLCFNGLLVGGISLPVLGVLGLSVGLLW